MKLHLAYCEEWEKIMNAYFEKSLPAQRELIIPLTKPSFCFVWDNYAGMLLIMKIGSDFCDICKTLRNNGSTTTDLTARQAVLESRGRHRREARREFQDYKTMQRNAKEAPSKLHLVFDFAEKVLLPHFHPHLGQFHLVTGLKFVIWGSCE